MLCLKEWKRRKTNDRSGLIRKEIQNSNEANKQKREGGRTGKKKEVSYPSCFLQRITGKEKNPNTMLHYNANCSHKRTNASHGEKKRKERERENKEKWENIY